MSAEIASRNEGGLLIIKTSGTIKDIGWVTFSKRLYEVVARHGCTRIIIDNSELEIPTRLIEYVNLEKYYSECLPFEVRFIKLAVVLNSKYKESGKFWETYCNNRGFGYKAFTSMEDASAYMARFKLE
ncbi:MAG: hypothetical protein WCA64_06885 [Gallionella sp.]